MTQWEKDIADDLLRQQTLLSNGYILKTCPKCHGRGQLKTDDRKVGPTCCECFGSGETWQKT